MKIDTENPRLTFAQIKLVIWKVKEVLAKSIEYGDSMEFADVEGNAQMTVARTAGVYRTDECTLELYLDEYAELLEVFGDAFYTQSFEISVSYEYGDSKTEHKLKSDVLYGCRFTKRSSSNQAGPDALTRTLSFKPMWIDHGGKKPLPSAMMPTGAK